MIVEPQPRKHRLLNKYISTAQYTYSGTLTGFYSLYSLFNDWGKKIYKPLPYIFSLTFVLLSFDGDTQKQFTAVKILKIVYSNVTNS